MQADDPLFDTKPAYEGVFNLFELLQQKSDGAETLKAWRKCFSEPELIFFLLCHFDADSSNGGWCHAAEYIPSKEQFMLVQRGNLAIGANATHEAFQKAWDWNQLRKQRCKAGESIDDLPDYQEVHNECSQIGDDEDRYNELLLAYAKINCEKFLQ